MHAVSRKTGWPGTTPAAIHPGWPGGRRVYLGVGVLASGTLSGGQVCAEKAEQFPH